MRRGAEHFLVSIKSLEELTPPVSAAIRAVQPDTGIHQMILIPPQEYPIFRVSWLRDLPFGWRKTPRRVLVFGDDMITLVEETSPDELSTTLIPYSAICDLHLYTVLLYAYTELNWVRGDQIEMLKLEFNLVGLPYIQRGLEYVRAHMQPTPPQTVSGAEPSLEALPLKFRNFLRSSLLHGETVFTVLFQPAIRPESRLPFQALIAPNYAAAITSDHLIFVEDGVSGSCRNYAITVRFYPLSRVHRVEVEAGQTYSWLQLNVGIGTVAREVVVPISQTNATILQRQLNEIISRHENQYDENIAHRR